MDVQNTKFCFKSTITKLINIKEKLAIGWNKADNFFSPHHVIPLKTIFMDKEKRLIL